MRIFRKLMNRETLSYLIFGVLTTLVNYRIFWVLYDGAGLRSTVANTVAFVVAVLFAFWGNKVFVFRSRSWGFAALRREFPPFLSARVASFLIEQAGLFAAEDWLGLARFQLWGFDGVMLAKAALAVVVVILNYVWGRLIFKRKG